MKNFISFSMASRLVLLASICTLLSACDQGMSDLNAFMEEVKARPASPIEPIPPMKPYMRFEYPGHDKDPFDASTFEAKKEEQKMPDSVELDKNRETELLENYPLDGLRMVGTVYKDNDLWALIKVPDGTIHRVRKGNYIGKNYGKITNVKEVGITLLEIVDNGFGGYKERDNELAISNPNKSQ
ncbi:pilus assembly protein PilP [Thiolinea disciformis]|uniref:pilus assembly protein PilP n=1 Tax=Thiolinea disciformis TaxID=125614 RepID=UPI000364A8C1|nr:pilus assembly protein PilP [Thiolinea disciformis]